MVNCSLTVFFDEINALKLHQHQWSCWSIYHVETKWSKTLQKPFRHLTDDITHYIRLNVSNVIIRLLRKVYLFISQSSLYCIALYVLKLQGFDHWNIILLRHYW